MSSFYHQQRAGKQAIRYLGQLWFTCTLAWFMILGILAVLTGNTIGHKKHKNNDIKGLFPLM